MELATLELIHPSSRQCRIVLAGQWTLQSRLPTEQTLQSAINAASEVERITFNTENLERWDTRLLIFLQRIITATEHASVSLDMGGLPSGVNDLLRLSQAVGERTDAKRDNFRHPFLLRVGQWFIGILDSCQQAFAFVGEFVLSLCSWLRGRSQFRAVEFWDQLQDCGPRALGIVALISMLVGLILAFVGSIQLHMFGAEIYIANLVGLGMFREMGAMMTGIIMAGRTGATFAAQLGAMQANGEIDALKTMGISPMGYLILPRTLALVLMMPLLCVYSDMLGIFGGFLVGVLMLDLMPVEYLNQTMGALNLTHFSVGIFKAFVFGFLIAFAGCFRGMHSGNSASAVGSATTSAVVTAIVLIVIGDAILTIVYNALHI
jgi:phospholipid/cholesterol/gamma-HCH transport system permease protein